VFQLAPPTTPGAAWTETVLYAFQGVQYGYYPLGKLVFDPQGNLYGTTRYGGSCVSSIWGCGTVFELKPPTTAGDAWTEEVLHNFDQVAGSDGNTPAPNLIWRDGALYGTTQFGGTADDGTVFRLVSQNGVWSENILHSFAGGSDGWDPLGGLTMDADGNLYGTTVLGGKGNLSGEDGVVFELSPPGVAGGPWQETILHSFTGKADGEQPVAGLWRDGSGNLCGTAQGGGPSGNGDGVVFKLKPPAVSGGAWTLGVEHEFSGAPGDGSDPSSELLLLAGTFYGTTRSGGSVGYGTVFSMVP
jgi:uncharacterized repeat protein (TIGR03803 family)